MYAAATLFLSSSRGRVQAWRSTVLPSRRTRATFLSSTPSSTRRIPQQSTTQAVFSPKRHPQCHQNRFTRCFAITSNDDDHEEPATPLSDDNDQTQKNVKATKKTSQKKKKLQVNQKIPNEQAARNLERVFDELAKKEGFTRKGTKDGKYQTFYADDATFEDDFSLEDFDEEEGDDDEYLDGVDEDNEYLDDFKSMGIYDEQNADGPSGTVTLDDDGGAISRPDDGIRPSSSRNNVSKEDDMEARLSAAQQDLDTGRITADHLVEDISREEMRRLGFRYEENPFDNEQPEKPAYQLVTNAMTCSACGADFQARNETKPGYLPPEKFEYQQKLGKLEELQQLRERADSTEWSPEDEIEWLLQTTPLDDDEEEATNNDTDQQNPATMADGIDLELEAEKLGLDWNEIKASSKKEKKVICKRCHGLQNFGKIEDALRPGWTDEPLMSQEKFRDLLRPLSTKPAVIVAIVDLFDFSGSVLPELDAIAGPENPVIIAANKADLLPDQMGELRVENWVRRELEYMGIQSLANVGGAVRLVSCKTGFGVRELLAKARKLADEMDCDVYIVGAANAGKSTLMNFVLSGQHKEDKDKRRRRAGNANAIKGALTTSPLPGTTLKFIKIDLGGGRSLYDTPGLLVPGTITQLLTAEELKIVVPTTKVEPITFRVSSGKCVLVGGMARISVIGDTKPFLFTFYVANRIKLHVTDVSRADDFIRNHAGGMLTPPLEPGPERMEQMGEFEKHVVDIQGAGWKEAAADITLTGLGWVAVTGAGTAQVEISVPKGIGVQVRPPLMPFDVWETTAKYTGGRAVRKSSKSKSGKRRKGVGRN